MEKIFYTNKNNYATSEEAVKYILKTYFHINEVEIYRNMVIANYKNLEQLYIERQRGPKI